jgi:hypothetical protein
MLETLRQTGAGFPDNGKSTGEAPETNFALANGHGIYRDFQEVSRSFKQ